MRKKERGICLVPITRKNIARYQAERKKMGMEPMTQAEILSEFVFDPDLRHEARVFQLMRGKPGDQKRRTAPAQTWAEPGIADNGTDRPASV